MKLLHLGDLHFGKSLSDFDLYEDQEYIINQILGIIEKEEVEGVLIAGDVYDKSVPSEAATKLLDYFLVELTKRGVKTFMISGNHDSDDRLNYGSKLFKENNIFISSIFNGELSRQTVKDQYGELDIYLLPFVKASQVKHYYPEADIQSYNDAVQAIIDNANVDESRRNIIVAHQFVTGGPAVNNLEEDSNCADEMAVSDSNSTEEPVDSTEFLPTRAGSEGMSVQNVGLVEQISYHCFDKFDYAALGHIHAPQRVGRDQVRYAGSPLKYSLSEVNNEKTVPLITMGEKGDVKIELVPLKPKRDLRHIRGEMKELLKAENITSPNDFIYVTLTDEDTVTDAMSSFQAYYPNTVKIDYDNSHSKEIGVVDIAKIVENKSFAELMSDFYEMIYGCGISEKEMQVMKEIAREAGVLDEAD